MNDVHQIDDDEYADDEGDVVEGGSFPSCCQRLVPHPPFPHNTCDTCAQTHAMLGGINVYFSGAQPFS